MPDPGTLLDGKYRLIDRIASGGMGEVWKARVELPRGKRRYCAVKFIRPDLPANADRLEQFAREALTGYDVTAHPYLVTTRDFGESPLGPYVVTELIDGPNLTQAADELRDHPPMLRAITRAGLLALYELHQSGKIHCDVSNNNILLSRTGAIKLADFGLARNRDSGPAGHVQGTIAFVSREEIELGQAFPQSDLYALGAVLYQLVTGHSPFGSETIWQVEYRMNQGPPAPLPDDLPADLTAIIHGLMEFRLDKRLTIPQVLDILHDSGEPIAEPDEVAAFVESWLATYMGPYDDHPDQTESDPGASSADPSLKLETGVTEPNPAPSRTNASHDKQHGAELIENELVTDRHAQDEPAQASDAPKQAPPPPPAQHIEHAERPELNPPEEPHGLRTARVHRPLGLLAAAGILTGVIGYGLWLRSVLPAPVSPISASGLVATESTQPVISSYPAASLPSGADDRACTEMDRPEPDPVHVSAPAKTRRARARTRVGRPWIGYGQSRQQPASKWQTYDP